MTSGTDADDLFFEELAAAETPVRRAPSRLKAQIYSRMTQVQAESGPLASLAECKSHGEELCVFEEVVNIVPVGGQLQTWNYCRVCHARVLAEKVENAPIWWVGCPYTQFQNR